MANEKRLIYLEDAIEKIVNFPSKVAQDAFYSKKQFTPMQMLTVVADRQYEIIDLLKQVKEVNAVEVVHGQWIRKPIGKYAGADEVCCSICGSFIAVISSDTGFEEAKRDMYYCNHCGAKMDGDGNG